MKLKGRVTLIHLIIAALILVVAIPVAYGMINLVTAPNQFANTIGPYNGTIIAQTPICSDWFSCHFDLPNPPQNDTVRLYNGTIIHADDVCQIYGQLNIFGLKLGPAGNVGNNFTQFSWSPALKWYQSEVMCD
jgi:hypothetical protein